MSRVLMFDDAGLFRMLEASFLKRLGCEIVRVSGEGQVVDKARQSAPDLILLDADQAGIDGPSCVRAIRSDPSLRETPVLVVSSADAVQPCCEAGATAVLARPLQSGALELALGSLGRIGYRLRPRRPARVPARVATGAGLSRGRVKDISRSGLFLALAEPLPLQASISLSLTLPLAVGPRSVRAHGVVVRQVPNDPESHLISGVGVRFVEIDSATAAAIDGYVAHGEADTSAAEEGLGPVPAPVPEVDGRDR